MRPMRQVLDFDPVAGTVECGAGIEWRELIGDYMARQVEACHPRLREFLAAKQQHDPDERFQSDWYRHLQGMLNGR